MTSHSTDKDLSVAGTHIGQSLDQLRADIAALSETVARLASEGAASARSQIRESTVRAARGASTAGAASKLRRVIIPPILSPFTPPALPPAHPFERERARGSWAYAPPGSERAKSVGPLGGTGPAGEDVLGALEDVEFEG